MKSYDETDVAFQLALADDSYWRLIASELETVSFVERFAWVCSMQSVSPASLSPLLSCRVVSYSGLESFRQNRPDWIETGRKQYFRIFFSPSFQDCFLFFNLDEFSTPRMQRLALSYINAVFQLQLVIRGNCAPCHCAFIEINGNGAVIAGRGNAGKTTCARRLPPPHRTLADDYALIFRHQGRLLAQAMPTWSNLLGGDLEYQADCTQVMEIAAFFFIHQSSVEHVESVNNHQAAMHLNDALQGLLAVRTIIDMPENLKKQLRSRIFDFAMDVSSRKPCGILHAARQGRFWHHLANALDSERKSACAS